MILLLYGGIALSALIAAAFIYSAIRLHRWDDARGEITGREPLFFTAYLPDQDDEQTKMTQLRKKA